MKFDFIVGNPPYQEETESDSTRKPPIYNYFMDQSYEISDVVELITPARFLFDAGYTPKEWNKKMLNDEHLKVTYYESDSSNVFVNTDIKGGIAITYRDRNKEYGAIGTFNKYSEMNSVLSKVRNKSDAFMDSIISSPLSYKLSRKMIEEHPDSVGRLRTSAFAALSEIFYDEIPDDDHAYIRMIGLDSGKRAIKYVRRDYITDSSGTLDKYTLLLAKANGAGHFGETLSEPIVCEPGIGYTQTFIGIGSFEDQTSAERVKKYIKCKFSRAMLGILKITQDCPGPKWKYVPVQCFSEDSDMDWEKPISEIDRQLYTKYGLSENEINFIETHVKEME